jgi:hypothetical protein
MATKNSKKEIANLRKQVEKLSMRVPKNPPKKSNVARSRKKAQPSISSPTGGGTTRVRNSEYLTEVVVPANDSGAGLSIVFNLSNTEKNSFKPPILRKIAAIYETYKVHSLSFSYHSSSSTLKNGLVVMGVDVDGSELAPTGKDKVFALSTKLSVVPYQQSGRLTVPTSIVAPSLTRYTYGVTTADMPVALHVWAETTAEKVASALGYVMIHYDITLAGVVP